MTHTIRKNLGRKMADTARVALCIGLLSGCTMFERLGRLDQAPQITPITNPKTEAGYRPVSVPMPVRQDVKTEANSLWRQGARGFFKDQRAADVGDIITIEIEIADSASLKNTTTRGRTNTEDAGISTLLGLEGKIERILAPNEATSAVATGSGGLVDLSSNLSNTGTGEIKRNESIDLKVAGVVVQKLPNGNLVLHGKQEVLVNHEKRILQVGGIIRPEDITNTNTIPFEKIAEARIAYGGEGYVSDVQQARYGQQVLDVLMPF